MFQKKVETSRPETIYVNDSSIRRMTNTKSEEEEVKQLPVAPAPPRKKSSESEDEDDKDDYLDMSGKEKLTPKIAPKNSPKQSEVSDEQKPDQNVQFTASGGAPELQDEQEDCENVMQSSDGITKDSIDVNVESDAPKRSDSIDKRIKSNYNLQYTVSEGISEKEEEHGVYENNTSSTVVTMSRKTILR